MNANNVRRISRLHGWSTQDCPSFALAAATERAKTSVYGRAAIARIYVRAARLISIGSATARDLISERGEMEIAAKFRGGESSS